MINKIEWTDLSYRQYLKVIEFQSFNPECLLENLVGYFYNCNAQLIPISEYLEKAKSLEFLRTDLPKVKMCKTYKINGTTYELMYNTLNLTAGQFFDYTNYAKKEDNLVDILSVIMIPLGHKYNDGYDLNKVREDILSMRVVDVVAINAFFLHTLKRFISLLTCSLNIQMKKLKMSKEEKIKIESLLKRVGEYSLI